MDTSPADSPLPPSTDLHSPPNPTIDVTPADDSVRTSPSRTDAVQSPFQHQTHSHSPLVESHHSPTIHVSNPSASNSEGEHDDVKDDDENEKNMAGGLEIVDGSSEPIDSTRRSSSSSEGVQRPLKRRLDPALYEPRRSGRNAGVQRTLQESSDESDSADAPVHATKRRKQTGNFKGSKVASPAISAREDPDSDSDEFYTNKKHAKRRSKAVPRRLADLSRSQTPQHLDVRFSSRQAAQGVRYAENESGDDDEDWDSVQNWTYVNPEDEKPGIDRVLEYRPRMHSESLNPKIDEIEFFVKWEGQAHYHASWETYEDLKSRKGQKRVKNFFDKIVMEDFIVATDPDITPEAKEQWSLDREKHSDELEEYKQIDRVIGSQQTEDGTEYMVKWRGLTYDYCTWESADFVSSVAQEKIDRFLNHSMQNMASDKSQSSKDRRSPHKMLHSQPEYIKNGKLRDFQLKGLNFLSFNWCNGRNAILADEMGLGKTVQSVAFFSWLRHERKQQGPVLVVVPLSTLPAWGETFDHWAPDTHYVSYLGPREARETIRKYEFWNNEPRPKIKFHVLLTTYEQFLLDFDELIKINWQFLAVDEAHRLKNRSSQLYAQLDQLSVSGRLLITGTPVQNNLKELSALIDFIAPGEVEVDDDMLEGDAADKRVAELNKKIKPLLFRRTKEEVENDLPPKREKILRVELADTQLDLYKNIMTRNYDELNRGATGAKQGLLNIVMQLKKASNHPFMFDNIEQRIVGDDPTQEEWIRGYVTSSGKMMLLDQLLKKMRQEGHRVLIFSQMVEMLNILGAYMRYRGYQCERLDGTTPSHLRKASIDRFNAPDSSIFAFLLSTRAGGLGINLMTADTVILFDSDWNPQADLQAMARAHRIGQKNPVTVYRLVSKDTIEEEIIERSRNKLMLEAITIQQGYGDKETKVLAKKASTSGTIDEPTSANDISRILRRRGQKMFEQTGNQQKLEELNIDAVLENAEEHETVQAGGTQGNAPDEFLRSLEYTDVVLPEWDEIIPQAQLQKIKEDRDKKETERLVAELQAQNDRGKRKAVKNADDHVEKEGNERAAKKQARQRNVRAPSESDDESDAGADPSRPLQEKEIRNLVRAYERFGALEDKQTEILQDAKLVNRTFDVVKTTLNEVLQIATDKLNEEKTRLKDLERSENKSATKKDKKAVLFDFKGVKRLNAETLTERSEEMRVVRRITSVPEIQNFRVPGASKPANYTCDWGAREDGMLCVGIARYGFGAWAAIRDDTDLGLSDKLFLEEHRIDQKEERSKNVEKNARSPGAVHLVRRANYLFSVLKASGTNDEDAMRALQNHHRNNKKSHRISGKPERISSASPAPVSARKSLGDHDGNHPRRTTSNGHFGHRERPDDSRRPKSGDVLKERSRDGQSHSIPTTAGKERNHYHKRDRSSSYQNNDKPPFSGTPALQRTESGGSPAMKRKWDGEGEKGSRSSSHHEHGVSSLGSFKKRKSESERPQSSHVPVASTSKHQHGEHSASALLKAEIDQFFDPARNDLRSLRAAKNSENTVREMQPFLARLSEFVENSTKHRSNDFVDQCWEYVLKYYWPLGKSSKISARKAQDIARRCVRLYSQKPTPVALPSNTPQAVTTEPARKSSGGVPAAVENSGEKAAKPMQASSSEVPFPSGEPGQNVETPKAPADNNDTT